MKITRQQKFTTAQGCLASLEDLSDLEETIRTAPIKLALMLLEMETEWSYIRFSKIVVTRTDCPIETAVKICEKGKWDDDVAEIIAARKDCSLDSAIKLSEKSGWVGAWYYVVKHKDCTLEKAIKISEAKKDRRIAAGLVSRVDYPLEKAMFVLKEYCKWQWDTARHIISRKDCSIDLAIEICGKTNWDEYVVKDILAREDCTESVAEILKEKRQPNVDEARCLSRMF